jgi:hypothetical protein
MKKVKMLLLMLLSAGFAQAQQTVVNDENVEVRPLSGPFTGIKLSGGMDVYLSQGSEDAVAVSASEDRYRDNVSVEVKDGVLYISYRNEDLFKLRMGSKRNYLRVYIGFKTLERLTASGACDIKVNGPITVPGLNIVLSGASDLKAELSVKELVLNVSGASDARLSGTAYGATITAAGASDVKGFDLEVETCNVKASGASDVNITVNKELSINASGASDVRYKGACIIKEMHSSGASGVGKKS